MNILSIQSHVTYGHVGNSAAVFALQRLGCEVWPINTVQLSNHTGYDTWKGQVFSAGHIADLVHGLDDRGALAVCDGVLSGYMGSVPIGEAILGAALRVKAANAKARYCCDPVIGNRTRGQFVDPGIAEFMRERAVAAADIVTPNHFELDRLTGRDTASLADIVAAVAVIRAAGPGTVLVTSVQSNETPSDAIDVIAANASRSHLVRTPRLDSPANGAGDLMAALFLFHLLCGADVAAALGDATSSVFGVLRRTHQAATPEMALIEAQQELVAPSRRFTPRPIEP